MNFKKLTTSKHDSAFLACGVLCKHWDENKCISDAYFLILVRIPNSMNDHHPSLFVVQIWRIRPEQAHETFVRRTFEGNKNFALEN